MRRIDKIKDKQIIRKEMYSFIRKYIKTHGVVPNNNEIAEGVNISVYTVKRGLRDLEEYGLIVNEKRGNSRNYRLATAAEVRKIYG